MENKNKPGIVYYHPNGEKFKEFWFNSDKRLHREDGPALSIYNEQGEIIKESWFLNGVELDKKYFEDQ